jgi:hypothetical protein
LIFVPPQKPLEEEMMHIPFIRKPALLLAVACAGVFGMHHGAVAQASYPLYCQGPLTGSGIKAPFKWASEGAGTQNPGEGQCAWADRGPRGTEIQTPSGALPGNVLCLPGKNTVGLNWFSLKAGQFYEWCAFRDPTYDNCINVSNTVLGSMQVEPPFLPEPICAK